MVYTRREFLGVTGGAVCATALGLLPACSGIPRYRGAVEDGKIMIREDQYDAAVGVEHHSVRIDAPTLDGSLILMRLSDGTYRALSAICTHQGCEVRPAAHQIQCPCHGSAYSLDGDVLRGPARRPLKRYSVHVANGVIEIIVDQPEKMRS